MDKKRKTVLKLAVVMLFVLVSGCFFCCGKAGPEQEMEASFSDLKESGKEPLSGMEASLPGKQQACGESMDNSGQEEPVPKKSVTAYICGSVKNPGVYTLPGGSRLYGLVEAAGGFKKKAKKDALNQAEPVCDGECYRIPPKKKFRHSGTAAEKTVSKTDNTSGKINLNTAEKETLLTLSGIGEAKADAILLYREENGGFQTVEDIMKITGIKEGVFNQIKDRIAVTG